MLHNILAFFSGACLGASVAFIIGYRVAISAWKQGCETGYRKALEVMQEVPKP